eukprot:Em0770g2a
MKANFLAVLALVSFAACCNGCAEVISCDDSVIRNGVQHYQQMLNDSSSNGQGCCPVIVPPGSNWLRHRGFQRISRKRRHHCRLGNMPGPTTWWLLLGCLLGRWHIQFADGYHSGSFPSDSSILQSQNYYYVTVYYCSNPPYPLYRCCGVLYGTITTFQDL